MTAPSGPKLVGLTVVKNATQVSVKGTKHWVAVKGSNDVTVEATTAPNNDAAEWAHIRWSAGRGQPAPGKSEPGKPNRRILRGSVSTRYHVGATLGGVADSVDVWILWATIEIKTTGKRPDGAASFDPGSRDNTEKLGAVTYESLSSSVIDEAAGVFVENMGASGKVAPMATLSPRGVHDVLTAGWTFEREVWSQNWIDGQKASSSNTGWTRDTSNDRYLRLTPDVHDRIFDLDGPDLRWGERSYETYNNFRQWVAWNGERCSEYAPWSWRARWHVDRDPRKQITLNELAAKHVALPTAPFYPARRSP
jgi:hypothetical protein